MNAVDLILGTVFAFALYDGVRRGAITASFSLIVWSLAFLFAGVTSRLLFGVYAEIGYEVGGIVRLLIFSFVLFIAAAWLLIGGRRLAAGMRRVVAGRPTVAFAERWLGVFPSLLRSTVVAAALLTAVNVFPVWPPMRDAVTASPLASAIVAGVESIEPALASLVGTGERPLFLAVIHGSEEQALHFPERTTARIAVAEEESLYALLDQERARAGLPALARDPRLVLVARAHANEMFELQYLSHVSPRTGKPSDRVEARGIPYSVMGENVAYSPSAELAHQGFLRSRSHRANLLDARFRRAGIGAISTGISGTLYVEVFTAP